MQIQEVNNTIIAIKNEPSKWWAWGLAILIALWSIFGVLGAAAAYYFADSGWLEDLDAGPYPDEGTSGEQKEWNETNEWLNSFENDLNSIYQPQLQLQFSMITLFAGFVACFLLFTRDPHGFKAAGIWLGIIAIRGTILQYISLTKVQGLYENIPGVDASMMTGIATGFSIASSLTCYLSIFGLIYIAAIRSKKEEQITESGFHK
jgi:hypothetical protein